MFSPQFIIKHWPLTEVSFGQVFVSYPTRRIVQVFASEGAFVAKIDDEPPVYDTPSQIAAVFEFLDTRSFSYAPALLKTKTGHRYVDTDRQRIVMLEYLSGAKPTATKETWAQLGTIARALNDLPDYPYPYAIDTSGAIEELRAQANTHPHRAQFHQFLSIVEPFVHAARYGLVHGEINLANTAQRDNGTLVLLDWDDAGNGPTLLDAGYPLLSVFLTEELVFHNELAGAFYHYYYAGQSPTGEEKDLLFRAALLHGLRYMQFANQQQRWERICFAVAHRDRLLSVLP